MDDLFQVEDQPEEPGFNDELLFVDEEPEEQGAEAQPVTQAGASNADIEALRAELNNVNKRLQDTQASFHQANQGRQFAEEVIRANRAEVMAEQQRRQAAAAMAPPQLTEEEIEALHNDPRAIVQAYQGYGEYVRQRTLAEVGPVIARLDRAARLSEAMVDREIIRAEQDARQMAATQWDINDAEYAQLAPHADALLQQAARGDADAYKAMRLNPGVIATAFSYAKTQTQGGVRVNKPAVAPSFGGGRGNGSGSGTAQKLPGRLVSTASKMERKLGLDTGSIANAPVRTRQQGRL